MNVKEILIIASPAIEKPLAIERGFELAREFGARVRLVAFVYDATVEQRGILDAAERKRLKNALLAQRREQVDTALNKHKPGDLELHIQIEWHNDFPQWVAEHCDNADLVVKSAHRSRSLLHLPTDWQLIRNCPVPVLEVVKPRWPKRPRIIATIDLMRTDRVHKKLNDNVIKAARKFADAADGELHICSVIHISPVLTDLDVFNEADFRRKSLAKMKPQLDALAKKYSIKKKNIHTPTGSIDREINRLSDQLKAECIVMGTTARTGIGGFVLGNSAEDVLQKANTDILALKPS